MKKIEIVEYECLKGTNAEDIANLKIVTKSQYKGSVVKYRETKGNKIYFEVITKVKNNEIPKDFLKDN